MKIHLVSDLHLEFAPIPLENPGADILVLAGDICVADYFARSKESPKYDIATEWGYWFSRMAAQFKYTFYIMGNHEHYHGRFERTADIMREATANIDNFAILDNQYCDYGGYRFIGTTLWTDFNRGDFAARTCVERGLNDYRLISTSGERFTGRHTERYHRKAVEFIDGNIVPGTVVISHHLPSFKSVNRRYHAEGLINYGYYSDLERFIADRPDIGLWMHGHSHSSSDYEIGATRVVANPRGYARPGGPPENAQFNPNLVLELP